MNKIFKVIWNHTTQRFDVVSELTRSKGKSSSQTDKRISLVKNAVALATVGGAVIGGQAYAATYVPVGGTMPDGSIRTVVIGQGSSVESGQDNTVIGHDARIINIDTATMGFKGGLTGINTGIKSVAVGSCVTVHGMQSIAIGHEATSYPLSTAIGFAAQAKAYGTVAIGDRAQSTAEWSTAIGLNATASGPNSQAIGGNSQASEWNSTALGHRTIASGDGSTSVGYHADATKENSAAFGSNAQATAHSATATGADSNASGTNATSTGYKSQATGANSVASGVNSTANASGAIAIGDSSGAVAEDAIAIGHGAASGGVSSTAIGDGTQILPGAVNSTAIGTASSIQGTSTNAYSLGTNNAIGASNVAVVGNNNIITSSASNTMVLGNNITATKPNSVILGEGSTDGAYKQITSVTIPNIADGMSIVYDGFNGTATGVVSIGSKGKERQLTNVAPGEISATSTDTINGSQLYAVAYKLGEQVSNIYFHTNLNEANQGAGDPATNKGRILDKAGATGTFSITAGVNAKAVNDKTVAMGYNAHAGLQVVKDGSLLTQGHTAIAIGNDSRADSTGSIAIGNNAKAEGIFEPAHRPASHSIAIGDNAAARGMESVSIGGYSQAGIETNVDAAYSVAVGHNAKVLSANGVAVGHGANVSNAHSVAIGKNANTTGSEAVALGVETKALSAHDTALGRLAVASGGSSTVVGNRANGTALGSQAFGTLSNAVARSALAVGHAARSEGLYATAVGRRANATAESAIAIGENVLTSGQNAIAIGASRKTKDENTNQDKEIHERTQATGTNAIAIGYLSQATATNSIAIGTGHTVEADNAGAFGDPSHLTAEAVGSYAVGNNNTITSANTFVLGSGIGRSSTDLAVDSGEGTVANSVYLGNESEVTKGVGLVGTDGVGSLKTWDKDQQSGATATTAGAGGTVSTAKVGGITYGTASIGGQAFAGATSTGAVSVGSSGAERRIQNVAAGEISKTSTDAINGSQLYAVAHQAAKPITFKANSNKDSENTTMVYASLNGLERVLGDEIVIKGASTNRDLSRNADAETAGAYSARNVQTVVDDQGVQIQIATNPIFDSVQFVSSSGPKITNDGGTNIKVAKADGSATRITNVANGTEPNDAVNLSQLNATRVSVVAGNNTYVTERSSADGKTYKIDAEKTVVTTGTGLTVSATPGNNNVTTYNVELDQATQDQLAKEETVSTGTPNLVTVTTNATKNSTGGNDFVVNVTKGAFNGVTTEGALNTAGTTDGVATVADVIAAVNKIGFNVTTGGNEADGNEAGATLINPGEEITYSAGKNLTVKREGNVFTYATADDVTFNNVTASNLSVGPVNITSAGINAGDTVITNVASGGDTDTNGANIGDIKRIAAKSVEKVVLDDTVTDNIATVNTESGDAAGNAGETYKVGVSKAAVKTAAKEAINVTGTAPISVAKTDENGVDTYTVSFDGTKAAESIPLTYKANGENTQTVMLSQGLNFTNGDKTVATVGADGKVIFDLSAEAKTQLAKEESVEGKGLATVTQEGTNDTGGNKFIVNVAKGEFNPVVDGGKLATTTTDGVATVSDVISAVNKGYWTANVDGSTKVADVKFGDSLNFVDGTATDAVLKDGGISFNVKTDGTTIKVDESGNLAVNTDGIASTEVVAGKNTTVTPSKDGNKTTYTVDATKTTVTAANGGKVEVTGGTEDANGVINYTIGLDDATKTVINTAVTEVQDSDSIDFTKTGNTITATVITGTSKVVNGQAVTTEDAKVATVGDIVNTINNVSWKVASIADGGENSYTANDNSNITAGDMLNINAGNNIKISGSGNTLNIATKDNVSFNNVTVSNLTATGDTVVNNFAVTPGATIDMGNNVITNVASGGDTDTNGANIGDIKRIAAKSVEKVVLDDTVADNIATVNTESGDAAGNAGETYKVGVSKAAVKTAAKEAINVTGTAPISVAKTDENGVDTYTVSFDGTKAAESIPLTYKANAENTQTVMLSQGLNFTNGDKTVATVGADGKVSFDLSDEAKAQLAKEETVIAGDSGLVTVTSPNKNDTGGKEFIVEVKKGEFNTATNPTGSIAAPTTDGVATTNDVVNAINKGYWTAQVGGNELKQVHFGDVLNFVNGNGTKAVNKDGAVAYDVNLVSTDSTVTFAPGANGAVDIKVNTANLPKTKLVNGKNTTVEGAGTEANPYKVNVQGNLTDITSISNGGTTIKLGDKTVNVDGATITNVANGTKAGDAVNYEQLQASQEEVVSTDKSVTITEGKTANGAKKFDLSVTTDGTTIIKGTNGELKVSTTDLTNTPEGKVNVPTGAEANKLVTASDIATAINDSGFKVKANGDAGELVNPGDVVEFKDGKNINITRDGSVFTVKTVDAPVFTSVQFNENGPIIKADASNNINVGKADGSATKITNVAEGTADTDAVNVKQLNDTVKANKTVIEAGNNVNITGEGSKDKPYVINAKDTTATASVKAGSSEFLTVEANGTTTQNDKTTTDYAVGLTDKAKKVLNNAIIDATDSNTVDFTVANNVLTANVKATDGKGTTANITEKGLTFDIKTDGKTIKVGDDGNLTVNVDNLSTTKLADGKNTTVEGAGTEADPYKVNVQGDLTDITSISNGDTSIKLGDATVNVGGATISNVKAGEKDGDAVNVSQLNETNQGWTITTSGNTDSKGVSSQVKLGKSAKPAEKTVTISGGKNIKVKQEGNTVSVATSDTPTFESVTVGGDKGVTVTSTTSKLDGKKELSVGTADAPTRITNVAPGVKDTDAVNVSQLKQVQGNINAVNRKVDKLDKRVRGIGASSAAASSLPQVYIPGKSMVAAAAGGYDGAAAVAVGYSRASDNGKLILKLQGTANSQGHVSGGVGVGYQW